MLLRTDSVRELHCVHYMYMYMYMYVAMYIVVAVHSQDSMRLVCANAILAVHYNYFAGSS